MVFHSCKIKFWEWSGNEATLDVLINLHMYFLSIPFSSQEAAWTTSNITAGQPHQIQCVVEYGLIPAIIDIMIKVNHD